MNAHSLKLQSCLVLILFAAATAPSVALGDAATDIQVFLSGGKLTTGLAKYASAFDETTFETHDPGFAGSPLPQGVQYGVQISQKLWYHSGVENDPITPVRGDVYITISDTSSTLTVTGSSGLQAGLILTENLSGSLHGHLDFVLFPKTGSAAPAGVYGLVMQITSPSYQTSDQFLLAIANVAGGSLTLDGIEYGEQAIFNAAVPEPSAVVLAGLGISAAAVVGARRHRERRRSPSLSVRA